MLALFTPSPSRNETHHFPALLLMEFISMHVYHTLYVFSCCMGQPGHSAAKHRVLAARRCSRCWCLHSVVNNVRDLLCASVGLQAHTVVLGCGVLCLARRRPKPRPSMPTPIHRIVIRNLSLAGVLISPACSHTVQAASLTLAHASQRFSQVDLVATWCGVASQKACWSLQVASRCVAPFP